MRPLFSTSTSSRVFAGRNIHVGGDLLQATFDAADRLLVQIHACYVAHLAQVQRALARAGDGGAVEDVAVILAEMFHRLRGVDGDRGGQVVP